MTTDEIVETIQLEIDDLREKYVGRPVVPRLTSIMKGQLLAILKRGQAKGLLDDYEIVNEYNNSIDGFFWPSSEPDEEISFELKWR